MQESRTGASLKVDSLRKTSSAYQLFFQKTVVASVGLLREPGGENCPTVIFHLTCKDTHSEAKLGV